MQAIDVTGHSRITQQLVPSTTALSLVCCSQFAYRKKKLLVTFGTTRVICRMYKLILSHEPEIILQLKVNHLDLV